MESVVTVGRAPDSIVQLNSNGVSRQHAKIVTDGKNYYLVDLKSGNGTYLNGNRLAPEEKNLLEFGDTISIDAFELKFHEDGEAFKMDSSEEVTDSDILEVKLLKKVLNAFDKDMIPSIEVLNGSAEGKKFLLTDEVAEMIIGRDPECDFPINEYVISRRHVRISKRWGGISIRDLESKNGTFINNRRVVEEFLHDGDRIALGTIVILFRNPQEINLGAFSDLKPKHRPAFVSPKDIPGVEEKTGEPKSAAQEKAPEPEKTPEGESALLEEWDQLEKSLSGRAPAETYPTPQARIEAIKRLTPVEIGMIGLGGLVLILALITIVNLLAS